MVTDTDQIHNKKGGGHRLAAATDGPALRAAAGRLMNDLLVDGHFRAAAQSCAHLARLFCFGRVALYGPVEGCHDLCKAIPAIMKALRAKLRAALDADKTDLLENC